MLVIISKTILASWAVAVWILRVWQRIWYWFGFTSDPPTLEERRNRQDIIEVFKMYRGYSSVALQELFEIDTNSKGTRGHSCKLKKVRCTRDIARFFSNRVINRWNALDQTEVDAPSINAFKQILVKVRNNRMGFFMD